MLRKIFATASRLTKVRVNKSKFRVFLNKVPEAYRDVMAFSYFRNFTTEDKKLGAKIEAFRTEISSNTEDPIHTFGSPHSNSDLFDETGRVRPGIFKASTPKGVAKTGTRIFGGIQLKMLVDAYGPARIFELGTNTGLSGAYFLSSAKTSELVTVEGSADLCAIADRNLARIGDNYSIKNMLFQDAIEELTKKGEKFDIAFLDGQHEKQATLYYTDLMVPLMQPGGMIIYDDIYWSEDMNSAWYDLIERDEFGISFDFGNRGVCFLNGQSQGKQHYNLCDFIGTPHIYRSGW